MLINPKPVRHFLLALASVFTGIFLFIPLLLTAQSAAEAGMPIITNYTTRIYKGHPQVWSIIQNDEGLMFFGTSSGITVYDGVNWRQIKTSQGLGSFNVRSMAKTPDGRIWYGTIGNIGYLETDSLGKYKTVSLAHLIPKEHKDFNDIWSIHYSGDHIYFQARETIFRLDSKEGKKDRSIKVWKPESEFMYAFYQNGIYYAHQVDKGLFKLIDDEFRLIAGSEFTGKSRMQVMLPYPGEETNKDKFMGSNFEGGFFLYDGKSFKSYPTKFDGHLSNARVYKGGLLSNNQMAISLVGAGGGLILSDQQGKVYNLINSKSGLQDESIYAIYQDRSGMLWLGLDNGIAKMELNSPITTFTQQSGLNSGVLSILRANDILYVGTPVGLYAFDTTERKFNLVNGVSPAQIFSLRKSGDDVFVAGERVALLRNNKVQNLQAGLSAGFNAVSLLLSKNHPGILYTGGVNGVSVFINTDDKNTPWHFAGYFPNTSKEIWTLSEDEDGTLWCGTQNSIVYRVKPLVDENGKIDIARSDVKTYGPESGLQNAPGSVFSIKRKSYFPSLGMMLTFNANKDRFEPDSTFGRIPENITLTEDFILVEDSMGRVWMPLGNKIRLATPKPGGGYLLEDDLFNAFPWENITTIYPEKNGLVWLGSGQGLIRLDERVKKKTEQKFAVILRQVSTGKDTLSHLDASALNPSLKHQRNSLRFTYAAPFFEQEDRTVYQTMLDGFDKEWSEWDKNSYKEYTNLPSGKYTFRVRAKNNYNTISEEAKYAFSILPPWYATWWAYALYLAIAALLVYLVDRFQRKRLQAIERNRTRDRELAQAKEIEKAYNELKATQNQLVQSEKMASLGELTAGIAHEIQNPLNFVNNFSEVNTELIDELEHELKNQNYAEAEALAKDIRENEKKINHHGKRADAIVKGMLQHSRTSTGQKEPTDLNALADEYLRLSYHGLRAKDKSFNANFDADLDPTLGKVNVIPQDLGRVILNLLNNAFYAVTEKKKMDLAGYQPKVNISTKKLNHRAGRGELVEIRVSDNGNGIPRNVMDKIFQPFFTTKPTGKGTGLGLSLSYDIITNGHSGELKVETKEGEGTTFIIHLPNNSA